MTTHTVGQQHATVSEQSSSAETRPEPIIFDLRESDDKLEYHGIRLIRFTLEMMMMVMMMMMSQRPKNLRRLKIKM